MSETLKGGNERDQQEQTEEAKEKENGTYSGRRVMHIIPLMQQTERSKLHTIHMTKGWRELA